MNGFSMFAETYRKAAEQGKIDKAQAEKKARIFDFLGTCDQEDFYILFDSTALNEIAKDYMRETVRRLVDDGTLEEEQGRAVRNKYSMLFEDLTAKEISEGI